MARMVNGQCLKKGRFRNLETETLLFRFVIVLLLLTLLSLTGCGDTDDDDDDDDINPADTRLYGTFEGGPVSGLAFSTDTWTGITGEEGSFIYEEGQTVTFAIGDLVLGSTAGKETVSPIDLVEGAAGASDPAVNNICVLLQSLDQDGHLNNGIQITTEIADIVGTYALNFNQSAADFASDTDVIDLLADLNAAGVFNDTDPRDRTLRSARAALEFIDRSLSERNTVTTSLGVLRGYAADETTWQYLGIPYAKPPIGELRWRPPQALEGWDGVREAVAWGDQAAQTEYLQAYGEGGMSEDCLYLNVTAPKDASGLPVMVWFHGGAFAILTGNTKGYNNFDGLTKKGVILVTVNHRLGPFGYIAHPLLSDETEGEYGYRASGNYGQMDLVAALEWVQSNIAYFGGDPGNVTIFGQSGGGGKVNLLMASEMAEGLFDKAILQSGASALSNTDQSDEEVIASGQQVGIALFDRLNALDGYSAATLEEARQIPWTAIVQADSAAGIDRQEYRPVVDGYYLKRTLYDTIVGGLPNDVPLLIGATSGDYSYLASGLINYVPIRQNPNNTAEMYVYKFSQVPDGWSQKNVLCGHGVELAYLFNDPDSLINNYLFGNVLDPLTGAKLEIGDLNANGVSGTAGDPQDILTYMAWDAEDDATAELTMNIWTHFAKNGTPGIDGWPAYTNENNTFAEIEAANVTVKSGLADGFPESGNVQFLRERLDQDDDPENGIEIIDDVMKIASLHAIDFGQSSEAFEVDEEIAALLEEVAAYKARASGVRNTVGTTYGQVSGYEANEDTWQYLGIPYAKPPVGDLRWRPPQPPEPWEGVRDALYWGDQAAQFESYQKYGEGAMSEDCLYLNITAPKGASNLPVMVWFHGGGLLLLTSNSMGYNNPEGLPTKGIVQVSVNHRLNFFGYMAHPLLSAEAEYGGSGNYGQMDLIAALQWVQDNIAAFGGDPDNVTIFGESGGGRKTLSLMASPQAAGLFHKAISQSGTLRRRGIEENARNLEEAEAIGTKLSDKLAAMRGVESLTLADLRAIPWRTVLKAAISAGIASDPYTNIDGYYLPVSERELIESGQFNDVPFMILANANDQVEPVNTWKNVLPWLTDNSVSNHYATLFTKVPSGWEERGVPAYHACELSYVHGYPESIIGHYQMGLVVDPDAVVEPNKSAPKLPIEDLDGDGKPAVSLVLENGAYVEIFDIDDIRLSAGWNDEDTKVANTAMTLWSNFAKTGDPNDSGDPAGNGLPWWFEWTPYTSSNDLYLEMGARLRMKEGLSEVTFPIELTQAEE